MTVGIEPPRNPNGTEGVNLSIEYCVVITLHNLATPTERGGFSVCVSTVDGTATGKNNSFSSIKYDTFYSFSYVYCVRWTLPQLVRTIRQCPTCTWDRLAMMIVASASLSTY